VASEHAAVISLSKLRRLRNLSSDMNHSKHIPRVTIGLIGDYSPQVRAHVAIPEALRLATPSDTEVETNWLATEVLCDDSEERLEAFDALWCVPASPYASMEGALRAIRFARERHVPFLGTCGGLPARAYRVCAQCTRTS
jgi:CTP synthase (UTP-ammonia lyase)